jgi:hypothetical protein
LTQEENNISFIFCYARSGGTFLNRFLNNFDNLVILSEAHPIHNKKGGIHTVKEQMKRWYGVDIYSNNYIDQIMETKEWCDKNDKHLVIRDWSYIDFAGSHLNNFNPAKRSTNLELLESRYMINKIAYVRDAIDICLSQKQTPEEFSSAYLTYVKYIKDLKIPIYKYEDFCENFKNVSNQILDSLGIEMSVSSTDMTYSLDSKNVIGDINLSRGNQSNTIQILPRKFAFNFQVNMINTNKELREANTLLGYETDYNSKDRESFKNFIKLNIKVYVSNLKKLIKKGFSIND